jgi:hypothetical protein
MESEFVVLTDNIGLVVLFEEFFIFVISQQIKIPMVYQDSTYAITEEAKGGSIVHNRYLKVGMNLY